MRKGNMMVRCDLFLTEAQCTYVTTELANQADDDFNPELLSWYSGDRVIGIGSAQAAGATKSTTSLNIWIEKTVASNDEYYMWELTLASAQ